MEAGAKWAAGARTLEPFLKKPGKALELFPVWLILGAGQVVSLSGGREPVAVAESWDYVSPAGLRFGDD